MRLRHVFLIALLVCAPEGAATQDKSARPGIELGGAIVKPATLTTEALAKFPTIEFDVGFMTSKGMERAHYKGVSLWAVLQEHGLKDLPGHHAELTHSFTVTGRDGYVIAFSLGEIAPNFGNTPMIITAEAEGKAFPPSEGFRLIVQGDTRGARSVKDVARIDVQ